MLFSFQTDATGEQQHVAVSCAISLGTVEPSGPAPNLCLGLGFKTKSKFLNPTISCP